jgi:hypothetical protein
MQTDHFAAAHLAALGGEWIAAWNSRDLERVLALYADDSVMTSDRIPTMGRRTSPIDQDRREGFHRRLGVRRCRGFAPRRPAILIAAQDRHEEPVRSGPARRHQ